MAKWQLQDFCKENLRNNEEFRHAVEKMIMAEEKTRERFPDRNN
jgi:lipopolysaccharide biosynthesis protein